MNGYSTVESVANNVWLTLTARVGAVAWTIIATLAVVILLPQYIGALEMLALHDKQIALLQIEITAAEARTLDVALRQQEMFSVQTSRIPIIDRLVIDVQDHEKRLQIIERGKGPR